MTHTDTGYSATGARSTSAPAGWPFGALDPVQQHRRERQERELQRVLEQQLRDRAAAARRAILSQAGEAVL